MNRIIQSIIWLLLLLIVTAIHGQNDIYHLKYESVDDGSANPPTYNDPTEFETTHVTSDYGRRNHPGATQWHRGVDFNLNNADTEDHILSLNDASVQKIHVRSGLKVIITAGDHHFGYGHLFEYNAPNPAYVKGDLVLIEMNQPYSDEYAIIDLSSDEERAFSQVGIGTTTHSDPFTKLTVAGKVHAKEVKVTANAGGADFVFENDYDLPGIAEVESFIQTNKHLPGIPSADEMVSNGIDVGELQIKLLQKIEELTLYVIELKRENEGMQGDNVEMKVEIEKLKRR